MADFASSDVKAFGFIGLGLMGKPMAANLAAKLGEDQTLFVYDLVEVAMNEVCESAPGRVTGCKSPKEVAEKASFIITMLPEGKHVKAVYIDGIQSLSSTNLEGKTLVDCSTIDAATTLFVKNRINTHFPRTPFYDAPVSGGVLGATKGTIAFFLGCHELDPYLPTLTTTLRTMGKEVIACGGPSLGIASKLSNNYLSGTITIACSEAFDMGIRAGVDAEVLYRVFSAGTAQNTICDRFCPVPDIVLDAPSSKGYIGGFKVQLMLKDYTLATQLARDVGSKLVLGEAGLNAWSEASEDSRFYNLDSRVVYQYIKSRSESV
ncbi:hypothetical protein D6C81_03487 [Aureobasidium pullulans]|uniref:3-hydroxyisobutyrate dehydrogenase n=1 Tax=Aureobasidium pullulans TaxID=5580 RepID=A0A4S8YS57_AURPU|nr:hypothetical protein D6D20_09454 [Aureobasidium pullulans]TIA22105.1 hypothetical protein D6C81_03487 [Aureobasidium pullulans]